MVSPMVSFAVSEYLNCFSNSRTPINPPTPSMSISSNGHHQGDDVNVGGEDSDIDSDFATAAAESGHDYYHPISANAGSFSESDSDDLSPSSTYQNLSEANGNGISSLDLNTDDDEEEEDDDEEEEKEEEVVRESEASISRAFREDEQRRRTPLSQEARERIVDVMRGIEFRGPPPAWMDRVSDEQWVDRLRRIREQTAAGSSS